MLLKVIIYVTYLHLVSNASQFKKIDLRSDTVTLPSTLMRQAMAIAAVGDDVYNEDPTIIDLEKKVASILTKESGLFVPSGTQSNLIAMGVHCGGRGSEIILGTKSHIFIYEGGGASAFMGASFHTIPNQPDGTLKIEDIKSAIRIANNDHYPKTVCVAIENTHNLCGGRVLTPEYIQSVKQLCLEHDLPLHMDGARLWNAAVALNVPVSSLAGPCDSISVCLSKGLGAPVGSVLVGDSKFITAARRLRKALGGGMRQAGILAAAGIYALDTNRERLADDHRRARVLAVGLQSVSGLKLMDLPETNILYFEVLDDRMAKLFVEELRTVGVLVNSYGKTVRVVTHLDISDADIQLVIEKTNETMRKLLHQESL